METRTTQDVELVDVTETVCPNCNQSFEKIVPVTYGHVSPDDDPSVTKSETDAVHGVLCQACTKNVLGWKPGPGDLYRYSELEDRIFGRIDTSNLKSSPEDALEQSSHMHMFVGLVFISLLTIVMEQITFIDALWVSLGYIFISQITMEINKKSHLIR